MVAFYRRGCISFRKVHDHFTSRLPFPPLCSFIPLRFLPPWFPPASPLSILPVFTQPSLEIIRCISDVFCDSITEQRTRNDAGSMERAGARAHRLQFSERPNTPERLARSKRASRYHSCMYRDYIARSPRKASQQDIREKERKREADWMGVYVLWSQDAPYIVWYETRARKIVMDFRSLGSESRPRWNKRESKALRVVSQRI